MLAQRLKEGRVIGEITKLSALLNEDIQEEGDYVIDEKTKMQH
jgi:preprotein translocase subunit SecA